MKMTTREISTITHTAAVAEPGAQVAPEKAPSKKGASQKKGAPKGQKGPKAAKPAAKPKTHKRDRRHNSADEKPVAREGTAKAKVVALLQRKDGATMDELRHATGWQPHYADVRIMPTCVGNPVCGAGTAAMESA
jgi:Protein of unknown function (DUF3489)